MIARLRYWWAILFLVPWTILCSLVVILLRLLTFNERWGARMGRVWAGSLLWVSGVRLKINGRDNVDPRGQYIFIANHTSAFDIPALMWGLHNQLGMLSKIELSYVPIFGWAMWAAGHFFVNRKDHQKAMGVMDQVAATLQRHRHRSLVIFPEGTRSLDAQLQPFKKGAFLLAMDTGIPVVPVVINGAFKAKSKYARAIEAVTIELDILPPMDPSTFSYKTRDAFVNETVAQFQRIYRPPEAI